MVDVSQGKTFDSGLACLVMIARLHQVAADAAQLAHHFRSHNKPFNSTDLVRAARHLKLKSRSSLIRFQQLETIALPAIACGKDGDYFLLARAAKGKVLIQTPADNKPQILTEAEFETLWSGYIILVTRRSVLPGMRGRVAISGFIRSIIKNKKL
ncbi:MAG: cysteine peptidase family C39 domain-containing protein [Motiliproteus sp.]